MDIIDVELSMMTNKINGLKFTAYDPQLLKQFYDKLFSNTIFKNSVNESGWDVSNVGDDFFFIQK